MNVLVQDSVFPIIGKLSLFSLIEIVKVIFLRGASPRRQLEAPTYYNCSGFAFLAIGYLKLFVPFPDFFAFSNLTLPKKTSGKSPQKDLM